jgi:enoyl-CoA hydratase
VSAFDDLASLSVSTEGAVATVTLRGPGAGNAMGPEFFRELPLVFRELDAEPGIRAIVLSGAAGAFSYGLDLNTMGAEFLPVLQANAMAGVRTRFLATIRELQAAITAVADCRTPVVSAISGWCIGGGVDLIAATDIRLASRDARFSIREVRLAIVADLGSLQRLVGIVGDGHLRELALTGGDIDAEKAERIGLVNSVHDDAEAVGAAADEVARTIAANPPLTVRGIKDVLDAERGPRVEAGLRYVAAWNAAFLASHDLEEAFRAFGDRREPEFNGE